MGLLGICDAISAYLHDLNLVSTAFRLLLAMTLSCIIGIDRGMKKRVAGVKRCRCWRHGTAWRAGYQRRRFSRRGDNHGDRTAS